ncbi:uncharacterized protein LOC126738115 isoform X2 [Anthonomus grandis grandis]|uniref:uncharacterized protein LOC126738115 isoform X2 n=1 Tax=Anthonomus grandis grandis TaxID=2921223 RepID=UPI00216521E7|nr:uncharacterized protein LOC126738115 isoform X2 [Anthonomus grandis grandis]
MTEVYKNASSVTVQKNNVSRDFGNNSAGNVKRNMIVLLLCVMMKIVEYGGGNTPQNQQNRPKCKRYRRQHRRRHEHKGKGMSELGVPRMSPDSDCNSNLKGSSLSIASSQDIEFVQDNSDYQWFLDYGYRDGCTNHHTSILSIPESYEAGDNYYDAMAKNMDANLAEADMTNRQGESFAEVSGSMMVKFNLDSFVSPHGSSQGDDCSANSTSMSICKSELLFSPVKETPMPCANFSVDSLDCDLHDMMLTCQANKDNYTIAFEGSVTTYSEESDYHDTDKSSSNQSGSLNAEMNQKNRNLTDKILERSMTQSDSSSFTTWSKLKKRNSDDHLRRPSGNNNNSEDESNHLVLSDTALKSQSMPNLRRQKVRKVANFKDENSLSNSSIENTIKRRPVKVFDIHHQTQQSSSGSVASFSDMATSVDGSSMGDGTNKHPNFSLVKLFMKQKSMSQEGMSLTTDQLSSSENWHASQSGESSGSENKHSAKSMDLSVNSKGGVYDLIAEEPEDNSASESIEQLSESVSIEGSYKKDSGVSENINEPSVQKEIRKPLSPKHKRLLSKTSHLDRSIQTSQFSEITNLKNATKHRSPFYQSPIKMIEPSFLSKLKEEGEMQKPVYVLYPNYVLPDLEFLNEKNDIKNILVMPQNAPRVPIGQKQRPFSFNDVEMLKRKGFTHVKDWDSLNILLPQEYRKILADVPEISGHIKIGGSLREKPSFLRCKKPSLNDTTTIPNNISSSSSTATQPSSGYRGSSSLLTDSQNSPAAQSNNNPLFVYRYDSVTSSEASLINGEKLPHCITTTPQAGVKCVNSLPQENRSNKSPYIRGILRKAEINKRFSVYEPSEEDLTGNDTTYNKRRSLPDPYYLNRMKRFSETEDEGVDAGTSSSSLDEKESLSNRNDFLLPHGGSDELMQLEEYLKLSGFSSTDEDKTEENLLQLRSYVSKFLALKINQDDSEHFGGKKCVSFAEKSGSTRHLDAKLANNPPNNSPNVSAFLQQRNFQTKTVADMTICEENENSPNYSSPQATPVHLCKTPSDYYVQKRSLINGVMDAVDQIMQHFSPASNQQELNTLGDSSVNPSCAKLALTTLCPALYAVLSDGLKPCLETSFGAINNSVWQVVEASSQQGPLTKALNDLVMRINSEDVISEGLVKFNAFIFGLLNVRSLDAWTSYLRTRESILKKHYTADSLLVLSHTGGTNLRTMLDTMVAALQPLAFLPFQFDLLFEYKQLHLSFKRMDSYNQPTSPTLKHSTSPSFKQFFSAKYTQSPKSNSRSNSESDVISAVTLRNISEASGYKERPRSSCVEPGMLNFKLGEDVNNVAKKRWSSIATNSKLFQVYDRLAKDDEEYADSLETTQGSPKKERPAQLKTNEPESLDSNYADDKPINGRRFKKLQQKWEMLSKESVDKESPPPSPTHVGNKSKIPRPITSPVRPSGIPVLVSPATKLTASKIPSNIATKQLKGAVKNSPAKKPGSRTSRVDQVEGTHAVQRPSSLPYNKPSTVNGMQSKGVPQRRAASSSLSRRPISVVGARKTSTPKTVRTLNHRLPSESGHLSYNEGEILKVVLEVDDKWLLCARGTQKGLVPKSAVIPDTEKF